MSTYTLTSLLKLREHIKISADTNLKDAIEKHNLESRKLAEIKASLQKSIFVRNKMQDSFFLKAKIYSCNKREVDCHVSLGEKRLFSETQIKKILAEQEQVVTRTCTEIEIAKMNAINAHRNLKLIERHYKLWLGLKKRNIDKKEQAESDDINSTRFLLNRPL